MPGFKKNNFHFHNYVITQSRQYTECALKPIKELFAACFEKNKCIVAEPELWIPFPQSFEIAFKRNHEP